MIYLFYEENCPLCGPKRTLLKYFQKPNEQILKEIIESRFNRSSRENIFVSAVFGPDWLSRTSKEILRKKKQKNCVRLKANPELLGSTPRGATGRVGGMACSLLKLHRRECKSSRPRKRKGFRHIRIL